MFMIWVKPEPVSRASSGQVEYNCEIRSRNALSVDRYHFIHILST